MIVLCYGVTKSGSTLAFELCKSVLQQKGFEQRRLSDAAVTPGHHVNFINEVSVPGLVRIMGEVSDKEIIALKLHAPAGPKEIEFIEKAIAEGKMKVHVNLRDPREICLSLIDAGRSARENKRVAFAEIKGFEEAAKVVTRQLTVCRRWGAVKGALHLLYNDVAFNTPAAVRQICADFSFEMFNEQELQIVIQRVFESFTQRNKAVKDRYKDDLTVRQNESLIDEVKGARAFIRRVCEQKDYSWFAQSRELQEEAG